MKGSKLTLARVPFQQGSLGSATKMTSYTAQTARTVRPVSLHSMAATANSTDMKRHLIFVERLDATSVGVFAWLDAFLYEIRDNVKKMEASTSARPTIPATASKTKGRSV